MPVTFEVDGALAIGGDPAQHVIDHGDTHRCSVHLSTGDSLVTILGDALDRGGGMPPIVRRLV